ncbi:ABC transporter ATP-binding protein [bacterium]|nr:ABC transporter ATP-binding protein [bacterium]
MNKTGSSVLLSAEDIHKSFPIAGHRTLPVLKGIDLKIVQGEILAVIGPSGAGKSTLLHILGALDRPTRGNVSIESVPVFSMNDSRLSGFRNRRIGFVFQFHHLLPDFSAEENVAMPALIARETPDHAFRRSRILLDAMGLSNRRLHKPRELSGGEQQRVAFARALVNNPVLVLADEPSGNLDRANSDALHELMWNRVRQENMSFVVVTHNPDLAKKADRVIEMVDGGIKKP